MIIFVLLNIFVTQQSEVFATDDTKGLLDLLNGNGNFSNPEAFEKWSVTSEEDFQVSLLDSGDEKALQLDRKAGELSFNDGFSISIDDSLPQHVRFYFASSNVDLEDTNFRLKNSKSNKTALSFRCGYAGFLRINSNQMVTFYNETVSTSDNQIWTKLDAILDWQNKELSIYINSSYMGITNFYHEEIESVDQVLIYNLYPETSSWWKNLEVCSGRCSSISHLFIQQDFIFGNVLEGISAIVFLLMINS